MGRLLFALGLQVPLEKLASNSPDVYVHAYLAEVYWQGPVADVEKTFLRFSELCQSIGLQKATEKCEVWSPGDLDDAHSLSENLGMKFARWGFVGAGCPLGSDEFVQLEASSAAEKTVQLVKRVLELPRICAG